MPPSPFDSISENARGAAYMTLGMLGFAVNDTITKYFGGELNLGQVVFIRGLFAITLVFVLAWFLGHLRPASVAIRPLLALRSLSEAVATFCFLTALFHLPIANVSAIMQALPLAITLSAAIFFGEQVGWRRYSAVAVGFAGVLVIIRPGIAGFDIYSVYVLGAVAACVVRDLTTRRLGGEVPALFITLVAAIFVTAMGGAVSLVEEWKPVSSFHVVLMASASLFVLMGYFFTVHSMRTGDIGFVSPFRYSVLLFSIIGGVVVYREYPDLFTYVGSAIVVATGIYTLYRERIVRRQAITPAPVRS